MAEYKTRDGLRRLEKSSNETENVPFYFKENKMYSSDCFPFISNNMSCFLFCSMVLFLVVVFLFAAFE